MWSSIIAGWSVSIGLVVFCGAVFAAIVQLVSYLDRDADSGPTPINGEEHGAARKGSVERDPGRVIDTSLHKQTPSRAIEHR
jgi:hypothetical protein